jgi:hypothetical protein
VLFFRLVNLFANDCNPSRHRFRELYASERIPRVARSGISARRINLTAKSHKVPLDVNFLTILPELCQVALKKATQDAEKFCHRQFWRTLLLNNNFPLNETHQGEDGGSGLIVHPPFPSWVTELSTAASEPTQDLRNTICDSIVSSFVADLNTCADTAAMGQCWHGVREEVFDFVREHEHAPRDEAQVDTIINHIDKGACEGLLNILGARVRSEAYVRQAKEAGEVSLKDLIDIVTAVLADSEIELPDLDPEVLDDAKAAIDNAWNTLHTLSFFQMCEAFEGVFRGTMVAGVCATVATGLTTPVDNDSFERTTAFMVQMMGENPVKSRIALVSREY